MYRQQTNVIYNVMKSEDGEALAMPVGKWRGMLV
jgi:hypothetical protein